MGRKLTSPLRVSESNVRHRDTQTRYDDEHTGTVNQVLPEQKRERVPERPVKVSRGGTGGGGH